MISTMEGPEPVSPGPHALNHDSMVTVSLSDIQSSSEHTQPDWRNLDIPPTPVVASHMEETDSFGPGIQDGRTTPTPEDDMPTPDANEEKQLEEGDNDVNWENLDKTEEQEPRGEGSDDVG